MNYAVNIPGDVDRYLGRLQPRPRDRILDRIDELAENPRNRAISKQLHANMGGWRSSDVGGFRILYEIEDVIRILDIIDIGPRGDIYKR